MLWLWRRPAAAAAIGPLAWEPHGSSPRNSKKKKKKKKKKILKKKKKHEKRKTKKKTQDKETKI